MLVGDVVEAAKRSAASKHPGRVPLALGRRLRAAGARPAGQMPRILEEWPMGAWSLIRLIARTLLFPSYRPFRLVNPSGPRR